MEDTGSSTEIATSKNSLKRAAKAKRYAATKLERRAREKQAKKEKKRLIARNRAEGTIDESDIANSRTKRRRTEAPSERFGGRVVVDLGFDDKMSDKEIISLTSQLAYTYSANRNASFQFQLIFSSLNGRTLTRLERLNDAGYKRWSSTLWWQDGYERLWKGQVSGSTQNVDPSLSGAASDIHMAPEESDAAHDRQNLSQIQESVVYLTADSENELSELKSEETYIIGGICDHNRYKNLCLNKAKASGIRTARLPIGTYMASLQTRKVLTVNQVFEILLNWVETRNWETAFHTVIPKRKFNTQKNEDDQSKEGSKVVQEVDVEQGSDEQQGK